MRPDPETLYNISGKVATLSIINRLALKELPPNLALGGQYGRLHPVKISELSQAEISINPANSADSEV